MSSFTPLLNLNRPSLFPAGSSGGHLLSRPIPSFLRCRSQRTSDAAVQPGGERGRYCAASAQPAGWKRHPLLSTPAFAAAALSGSAQELGFDKHLHQGAVGGGGWRLAQENGKEEGEQTILEGPDQNFFYRKKVASNVSPTLSSSTTAICAEPITSCLSEALNKDTHRKHVEIHS